MSNQIIHEGEITLGETVISCYVLKDGTRVLSGRGMQEALSMVDEVEEGKQKAGTRLTRYLGQKSLKPFIYKGKELDHFDRLIFPHRKLTLFFKSGGKYLFF
jgi:hypothetical protein